MRERLFLPFLSLFSSGSAIDFLFSIALPLLDASFLNKKEDWNHNVQMEKNLCSYIME